MDIISVQLFFSETFHILRAIINAHSSSCKMPFFIFRF